MRSSSLTASHIRSTAISISSSVLNLPQPIRIDECACSSDIPMTRSTCDGSTVPVVHAEPADITSLSDTELIMALPSTPSNRTLRLCGSLRWVTVQHGPGTCQTAVHAGLHAPTAASARKGARYEVPIMNGFRRFNNKTCKEAL